MMLFALTLFFIVLAAFTARAHTTHKSDAAELAVSQCAATTFSDDKQRCDESTRVPSSPRRKRGAVLLVPHGGGPMPLLGDPDHEELTKWLSDYPSRLAERRRLSALLDSTATKDFAADGESLLPAAELLNNVSEFGFSSIVVFSAHWEDKVATISSGAKPSLIYDYSGFPRESYSIQYKAPGSPPLAKRIADLLTASSIPNRLDDRRGWDHGVFVPLKLMFPKANVPVVQVSLVRGLDPALHIAIGKALRPLVENENVLIVGSGFTFHNMGAFFGPESQRKVQNVAFESWLKETCSSATLSEEEREERLVKWAKVAPHARFCHPREEHLIPLHVCFGAGGGGPAEVVFDGNVLAHTTGYLWE